MYKTDHEACCNGKPCYDMKISGLSGSGINKVEAPVNLPIKKFIVFLRFKKIVIHNTE